LSNIARRGAFWERPIDLSYSCTSKC
jgi:hypothetical protein